MVAPVLQIGLPGTQEMMIILLIAVLLFGANKIPKLARSTGQAMGEFQKGREEVEQELSDIKEGENGEPVADEAVDTSATETSSVDTSATETSSVDTSSE